MERARDGEVGAFETLFRKYSAIVEQVAFRVLRSRERAEEAAQQVFLQLYRARGRYEPRARLLTFIHRITINACRNELRRREYSFRHESLDAPMNDGRSRLDAGILDQGSVDPAEQVAVGNLVAAIQGVLEKLSPNQRAAFRLGRVEGLRYGDIAEHLGITVSAVKSLIFRATNELRRELRPFLQVSDDPEKFRTANNNKGTSVEPVPLSR